MTGLSKLDGLRLAAALAGVLVVGVLDQFVGTEVGLALFYLVPVAACGWKVGRTPAIVVALIAAGCWVAADVAATGGSWSAATVWNGFTRVIVFLFAGVTMAELRKGRRELELLVDREAELARTDLLTGLPNSRAFLNELGRALAIAERAGHPIAIAYIDLDNFKQVNDHYGHDAGDDLLRRVATVLSSSLRRGDLVARLAGDEFAVLFNDADPTEAEIVARRIVDAVGSLGQGFPAASLSASVGLATAKPGCQTPDSLLKLADDAMYRAKNGGKGRVTVT